MFHLSTSRRTLAAVLSAAVLLVAFSAPVAAKSQHCPDKNHPSKVERGNMNDVVLAAGTIVCVKGSTDATGKVVADGIKTLEQILGNGHDVSYYIVYGTADIDLGEPRQPVVPVKPVTPVARPTTPNAPVVVPVAPRLEDVKSGNPTEGDSSNTFFRPAAPSVGEPIAIVLPDTSMSAP